MKRFATRLMLALMLACSTGAHADPVAPAHADTDDQIAKLALDWFGRMKSGKIDRTRLSAQYNAQLSDEAVRELAHELSARDYGAAPEKAEVMEKRSEGDQTVYLVRLTFPRGDSGSLLLGMNANSEVTGVVILGLPGD